MGEMVEVVCPACDGVGEKVEGYYDPESVTCWTCDGKGGFRAALRGAVPEADPWLGPEYAAALADHLGAVPEAGSRSSHPDDEFVAQAQRYRAEHEATHEAEMCGGPCIVLGLAGDDPDD